MNENEYLSRTLTEQLDTGSPVVLISVMRLEGSTPRQAGTKMIVGVDGKSFGTIGGGTLENAAINEAKKILSGGTSKVMLFDLTGKDNAFPDMICGGTTEILFDCLLPSLENREFAARWHQSIVQDREFYVLTHFQGEGTYFKVLGHAILLAGGSIFGSSLLTSSFVTALEPELHNISAVEIFPFGDTSVMVDRIRRTKTLYCFGAGHVAVPTTRLAAMVGFRVVVIDDRSEFANVERFPDAYSVRVIEDFDKAFDDLEIDADSFIVIVTRGHQYDRVVLGQAIQRPAGYIGMISSRRKRDATYAELIADGTKKEQLERVHSPIGIDIGGETPEEIAVSIVAELINERSKK